MTRQNLLFLIAGLCFVVFFSLPFILPNERANYPWQRTCDSRCATAIGLEEMAKLNTWECAVLEQVQNGKENPDPAYLAGLKDPEWEKRLNVEWLKALRDKATFLKCP